MATSVTNIGSAGAAMVFDVADLSGLVQGVQLELADQVSGALSQWALTLQQRVASLRERTDAALLLRAARAGESPDTRVCLGGDDAAAGQALLARTTSAGVPTDVPKTYLWLERTTETQRTSTGETTVVRWSASWHPERLSDAQGAVSENFGAEEWAQAGWMADAALLLASADRPPTECTSSGNIVTSTSAASTTTSTTFCFESASRTIVTNEQLTQWSAALDAAAAGDAVQLQGLNLQVLAALDAHGGLLKDARQTPANVQSLSDRNAAAEAQTRVDDTRRRQLLQQENARQDDTRQNDSRGRASSAANPLADAAHE